MTPAATTKAPALNRPISPPRNRRLGSPSRCAACGGVATVIETRSGDGFTRRRRACTSCAHRWTTEERVVTYAGT